LGLSERAEGPPEKLKPEGWKGKNHSALYLIEKGGNLLTHKRKPSKKLEGSALRYIERRGGGSTSSSSFIREIDTRSSIKTRRHCSQGKGGGEGTQLKTHY